MTSLTQPGSLVAIACGGTGGHLFPGLAVAARLRQHGCAVMLFISPKEVDQQAVKSAADMQIVTLPAVGLTRGGTLAFVRSFARSFRAAKRTFSSGVPGAALAMGGFTSAPPLLAARRLGAPVFLHESNSIPGRANRWLSWMVERAFVGFPGAAARLHTRRVTVTGTPVRPQFQPRDPRACRSALGLAPDRPVLLVSGGSQGASGINAMVMRALPLLAKAAPELQFFHLTGRAEAEAVQKAYAALHLPATVHAFFEAMELALGAATAAVSRAGASSLAELAALRLPSLLIPYPAATDNHQFHNARAFEATGAARLIEQRNATPETFSAMVLELVQNTDVRQKMQSALARWHSPAAAQQIAEAILERVGHCSPRRSCPGNSASKLHRFPTAAA